MLTTWRSETERRLAELDAAVAATDGDALARLAHAMRSGAAALGALPLARLCGDLEDRLRAGSPVDVDAAGAAVRAEAERATTAFAALALPVS